MLIKKSRSDDRLYRYLRLNNDLRCLLVSDKDAEKSAACLHVGVGSLHDPPQANGLAHFLEHMLFLGTKKFPSENHYSQFVQGNGGAKNAATGEDYTYYYFDVKNEAFPEAVDIFSQFFKEPLFTETAAEREMQAVDSEYKKNLSEDSRRLFQLEKSVIVRPNSVLNKFSTGGLETLQHDNVREELLKFHEDYYSSNIMRLVMVGRDSLDNLEKLAVENFQEVPNKNVTLKSFKDELVYDENSLGKLYKVVPHKNLKKLRVQWNLPFSEHLWREKPASQISHILGHEGPNSLLSLLIQEGLATSLSSGNSNRMRAIDQLTVDVGLTDKGEDQYERVLEILFQFINKLRQEGPKKYIFDEKQQMHQIDFDYKTKSSALNYAQSLAGRMLNIEDDAEIPDMLWRPYAYERWSPEEIQSRLELMTPQNCFVIFQSKKNEKEGDKLQKEKWYGTPYTIEKIEDQILGELAKKLPDPSMKLGYPPQNEFLPSVLTEMKIPRDIENTKPAPPQKLSDSPLLWYKQDDTFDQPYVSVNLKFQTIDCQYPSSALSQIFISMWRSCLNEHLRELTYMGQLAGISVNTGLAMEHISWCVYGYNDINIARYISEVLKNIQNYDVTEQYFNNMKDLKIRAYENTQKTEPYQRFDHRLFTLIMKHNQDYPEILKALKDQLDYKTFLDMKNQWLKNIKIEWLVMGHINQEDAVKIVKDCENSLVFNEISQEDLDYQRVAKFPPNYLAEFEEVNQDPTNPNSGAVVFFQHGLKTYQDQAVNSVLFQLLKEPFFNQLRTQQQLGYIVACTPYTIKKIIHGKFYVQSNVQGPDYLVLKINEFLAHIKDEVVPQLSDEQIERAKQALINNLKQKDLNLAQEAGKYWHEILEGDYEFDERQKKIEALGKVTRDQVVDYFNNLFFNNPKRLNIKMYSQKHFEEKENIERDTQLNQAFYHEKCKISTQEKIDNYRTYKTSMHQYPRL
eukprot:403360183